MKELSQEEIENFTMEKAQEIIDDYSKFLKSGSNPWPFEDELPWRKWDILLALLTEFESAKNKSHRNILLGTILSLDCIPRPKEYQNLLRAHKKAMIVIEGKKRGLTKDEIIKKI